MPNRCCNRDRGRTITGSKIGSLKDKSWLTTAKAPDGTLLVTSEPKPVTVRVNQKAALLMPTKCKTCDAFNNG